PDSARQRRADHGLAGVPISLPRALCQTTTARCSDRLHGALSRARQLPARRARLCSTFVHWVSRGPSVHRISASAMAARAFGADHTVDMAKRDGRCVPPTERHMKRPVWAALGVVIVALAVPTAALATHNGSTHNLRHHGHGHGSIHRGATGSTGAKGANSVLSYIQGTLVLDLAGGGSVTGAVTDQTRFVCVGQGWGGQGGRHSRRNPGGKGGRWTRHFHSASTGSTGTTGSSGSTGSTGTTGSTGSTGWTGRPRWAGRTRGPGS